MHLSDHTTEQIRTRGPEAGAIIAKRPELLGSIALHVASLWSELINFSSGPSVPMLVDRLLHVDSLQYIGSQPCVLSVSIDRAHSPSISY